MVLCLRSREPDALAKIMKVSVGWTFLSAVLFVMVATSEALPIPQFDAMSKKDQARYLAEVFSNSIDILVKQKRLEDAQKVLDLFTKKADEERSKGLTLVLSAIAGLRNLPVDRTYHVEHAFADALRDHGVPLSSDELKQLARAGKNFKPVE